VDKVKEFISLVSDSEKIVLVSHVNPDGDAIGSLTGMKQFLQANGKETVIIVPNKFPEFLGYLDPNGEIIVFDKQTEEGIRQVESADLIICMDFNSLKRIDALGDHVGASGAGKVLIDHHLQPDNIFDVIFSDVAASSTCEVAYYLIKEMVAAEASLKPLDLSGAISFYTGLMTDTNNFANSVRPQTFLMGCELLQMGVDKEDVQFKVYSGFREQRMRMMGYMLHENMKLFPERAAGLMVITKELKERFDFADGDSEGFVNLPLNIKGVEVSALFTEADGYVKVSLRSKGDFSVNKLSRGYFNGGGHERAAGGKIFIPIDEVEAYFLKSLDEYRHTICNADTVK
jgi:phosphoesterase RecJ-like protein